MGKLRFYDAYVRPTRDTENDGVLSVQRMIDSFEGGFTNFIFDAAQFFVGMAIILMVEFMCFITVKL